MTTTARKIFNLQTFNLHDHENNVLTCKNLDNIAIQKDNDYNNEKTAWIFEDGSALVKSAHNYWQVITNYGLHCDNEKL
jgi:hypothetical protein